MTVMNPKMPHLRELEKTAPRTAIGRVISAWAVIKSNIAAGKKTREVYDAAMRDGLDAPYEQFRVYLHRLRKRELRRTLPVGSSSRLVQTGPVVGARRESSPALDPLRNLREQRAKAKGFDYNPFPREELTK
jgi:hypothetical protein